MQAGSHTAIETLQEDRLHTNKIMDKIIVDIQILNHQSHSYTLTQHIQHKQHNNSKIIGRSEVIYPEISGSENRYDEEEDE